jgi:hypothetical protein
VARMVRRGEIVFKISVGKPEESRTFGKPKRRLETTVGMDLKGMLFGLDWIHLTQARIQ